MHLQTQTSLLKYYKWLPVCFCLNDMLSHKPNITDTGMPSPSDQKTAMPTKIRYKGEQAHVAGFKECGI